LKTQHQDLKLLIAPRHPERFAIVEQLILARGLRCLRRTTANSSDSVDTDHSTWDVFLLDTIGELSSIFSSAQVVFIGGSLVPRGGHNVLEPAAASRAIVFGSHMENFREISALFIASGAAIQVHDAEELARVIDRLLRNSDEASRLGQNARILVERNIGATQRVMPYL
jgi:3-deoxy-D-manno-octulosonic-acid transferase